jgi:hypothetical protein
MTDCGDRLVHRDGRTGMVVGHVGTRAIVSLDAVDDEGRHTYDEWESRDAYLRARTPTRAPIHRPTSKRR